MKEHDQQDYNKNSYNCDECLDTGFYKMQDSDGNWRDAECGYCRFHEKPESLADIKLRIEICLTKMWIQNIGVTKVSKATGISRQTLYNILKGKHELSLRHYMLIKETDYE